MTCRHGKAMPSEARARRIQRRLKEINHDLGYVLLSGAYHARLREEERNLRWNLCPCFTCRTEP